MHQLGTRHVGREQIAEGRELLLGALDVREEIGDLEGAEITRRNLEFAGGAPPRHSDGDGGGPTPPPPSRIWLGVIVSIAVIAAGIFAAWLLLTDSDGNVVPDAGEAGFNVDPGELAFADQVVATEGSPLIVTIASTGDRTLRVGRATVEPEGDFFVQTNTCARVELPRGAECSIAVAFRPSAEGDRSAALAINHSAEGSPLLIELTGLGTAADGATAPVLLPDISVDPEGALEFTKPREQRTVTVSSIGEAPLELDITLDEFEAAGQYAVETNCPTELAPSQSCAVTVTFVAVPELDGSATLLIGNNVTPEPIAIPLTGVPQPVISVGEFAFDDVDGRPEAVATVSNAGTAPFDVLSATTTDETIFQIPEGGNECGAVGIGRSCSIIVAVITAECSDDPFTAQLVVTDSTVQGSHGANLEFSRTCVD